MPLLNDLRDILEQTDKLATERPHLQKLLTEHREKLLQHLATLEKHEADLANHAKIINHYTQAIESSRLYCTQITNIQREKIPEYRQDIAAYLAACSCCLYRVAERYAPDTVYDPCLSKLEAVTIKEEYLAKPSIHVYTGPTNTVYEPSSSSGVTSAEQNVVETPNTELAAELNRRA